MTTLIHADGYDFLPGVSQYSGGVVASPGHRLVRVQYARPLALDAGLRLAGELIRAAGRPASALAAVEMRSPAPFSDAGFAQLNARYTELLAEIGVELVEGWNPIARSNVCPVRASVPEVSVHAFTFADSAPDAASGDYVVSGGAEAPEGRGGYEGHIVAFQDTSRAGLARKAEFVAAEMQRRREALGVGDRALSVLQVYSVHEVQEALDAIVLPRFELRAGANLIDARPPVVDLEFEMDCRSVTVELLADPEHPTTAFFALSSEAVR